MATWSNKALSSGVIEVMDLTFFVKRFGNVGGALLTQLNNRGKALSLVVDRGEAYSHAAAEVLNAPILTNDIAAIRNIVNAQEHLETPILRAWDIVVFGFQTGILTEADCDQIRKHLSNAGETLHKAFKNCSFENGIGNFYPRLLDADQAIVGLLFPNDPFDERLWIKKQVIVASSA